MTSPVNGGPTIGLTTIPRAVLSAAAGMVHSVERAVVGDSRVRTSRSNAWEAICADREQARQRDEVRQMLAALVVGAPPPAPKVVSPATPVTSAPLATTAATVATAAAVSANAARSAGTTRSAGAGVSPRRRPAGVS